MKRLHTSGFTLVEIVITIGIMAILFGIVSLNFNTMQKKYAIENQAKEIMADFSNLRMSAIQTKSTQMAVMSLNPKVISFRKYSSDTPTASTGVLMATKYLKYAVSNNPTGTPACTDILFDQRGFSGAAWTTIYIQPVSSGAIFDCLVISPAHINLGQYNGTSCIFK